MWVCAKEISIVLNTRNLETAIKHFTLSFVGPRHFKAYIVTWFALVLRYVLRHNCQSCGEMTVDQLANRKHLNEILGSFCIHPKCD